MNGRGKGVQIPLGLQYSEAKNMISMMQLSDTWRSAELDTMAVSVVEAAFNDPVRGIKDNTIRPARAEVSVSSSNASINWYAHCNT